MEWKQSEDMQGNAGKQTAARKRGREGDAGGANKNVWRQSLGLAQQTIVWGANV